MKNIESHEKDSQRKDRIKVLAISSGTVILIVIAMIVVGKMSSKNRLNDKESEEVAEGVEVLHSMESKDIAGIESELKNSSLDQEGSDDKTADTSSSDTSEGENITEQKTDALTDKSFKEIFSDSVVMGDSIAAALNDYDMLNASSVIAEVGVSLTALDDALETVQQLSPRNIFLYYGFNDIGHVWDNYDKFRSNYETFIINLKAAVPNATIYVNAIFPVLNLDTIGNAYYADVSPYNAIIQELCVQYGITYIDSTSLVQEDFYAGDGYHFKSQFYPLWLNNMANAAGLQ